MIKLILTPFTFLADNVTVAVVLSFLFWDSKFMESVEDNYKWTRLMWVKLPPKETKTK